MSTATDTAINTVAVDPVDGIVLPGNVVPPPAPPRSLRSSYATGVALTVLVLAVCALLQVLLLGRLEHSANQQRLFDRFRAQLASGTAPVGGLDSDGRALPLGSPVAYLEIPEIGLTEVVVEGTASASLFAGPGHRRDTVLPGQVGHSVLFGRRALYGAPFSDIGTLEEGDLVRVTTAQGVFSYRVVSVRRAGDPVPEPLARGASRLTLVTADGTPFLPGGALYVDANLDGDAVGPGPRLISTATLPAEEQVLSGDSRTLWSLVLWLQALLVVMAAAVWSWARWGRPQTWIVFVPTVLLVGLMVWDQFSRLLPNLT